MVGSVWRLVLAEKRFFRAWLEKGRRDGSTRAAAAGWRDEAVCFGERKTLLSADCKVQFDREEKTQPGGLGSGCGVVFDYCGAIFDRQGFGARYAYAEGGQIASATFWAAPYNCEAEAAFSHLSKTGIHMLDTVRFDPHFDPRGEIPERRQWSKDDEAL